jgi:hypothetical protein
MKLFNLEKAATPLVLFGLWLFFLRHAIQPGRSLAMFNDNEFMLGPLLASMSESLRSGSWPLRMGTVLGGFPLYNFTQLSVFYPFYFTPLPIYQSPLDTMHSMHWVALLHIFILEINMYVFIRVLGASRFASFVGAAMVAFSANSFIYVKWINIIAPYSWLPLYFAGLIGIIREPGSIKYFSMTTAGIVLLTLASPAQPLIHAVFVTLVFLFFYCRDFLKTGGIKDLKQQTITLTCVTVTALLIAAPVIIPAVLEFKDMIRWVGMPPPVIGNNRMSFKAFTHDQLTVMDLTSIFVNFRTAAVGAPFVGSIALTLAAFATVIRIQSWLVKSLLFLAIYSLISSTGSNLGLAYFNYFIPLLDKIREPSRFLILFILPVSVLAAFGIDEMSALFRTHENKKRTRQLLIISGITLSLTVLSFVIDHELITLTIKNVISLALLIVLFLATWLSTRQSIQFVKSKLATVWGISGLILLTLQVPWQPSLIESSLYLTRNGFPLEMAISRVSQLDPNHDYRVIFDGTIEKKMASMLASYQGVRTFNSTFCPAPFLQFNEIYYHKAKPNNYFRTLGAKYLVCKECPPQAVQGYNNIDTVAGYDIYESTDVLPHHYIAHQLDGYYKATANFEQQAGLMNLSNNILFVDSKSKINRFFQNQNITGRPACISKQDIETPNHKRFIIECNSAGVFVLNEFFDKGWRGSIDGVKNNTLKVNGSQIGIGIMPGTHQIDFRYLPTTFIYSLPIMFFGFVFFILYIKINKTKNEFI